MDLVSNKELSPLWQQVKDSFIDLDTKGNKYIILNVKTGKVQATESGFKAFKIWLKGLFDKENIHIFSGKKLSDIKAKFLKEHAKIQKIYNASTGDVALKEIKKPASIYEAKARKEVKKEELELKYLKRVLQLEKETDLNKREKAFQALKEEIIDSNENDKRSHILPFINEDIESSRAIKLAKMYLGQI